MTPSTRTQAGIGANAGARGGGSDVLWAFTSVVANVTAHTADEFSGSYRPIHRSEKCLVTLELPIADLPSRHASGSGKTTSTQAHARTIAGATTAPAAAWWRDIMEEDSRQVVERMIDQHDRPVVRVELRPSGGQCGDDLVVEWYVKL